MLMHKQSWVMYDNGQGVLQDNVLAHMWFNLGAANGNEMVLKIGIS